MDRAARGGIPSVLEVNAFLAAAAPRLRGQPDRHTADRVARRAVAMGGTVVVVSRGVATGLAEAEARFEEALVLASDGEDPLTEGRATNNLGMIAHIRGRYNESLSRSQVAVPACQRTGSLTGLAETHHIMALALRELAQLDAAEKQERRAIEFAREAGNGRLLAMAHVGRAELLLRRGTAVVAAALTLFDRLGAVDDRAAVERWQREAGS
jgi:tetratricopeptide (TPR) repeat protein